MVSAQTPEIDKPRSPQRPRRRSPVAAIATIGAGVIFGVQPLLNLLSLPSWLVLLLMLIVGFAAFDAFLRVMRRRYPDDPRYGPFSKDGRDAAMFVVNLGIYGGMFLAPNHLPLPGWLVIPLVFVAALAAFDVFFRVMRRRYPDDPRFGASITAVFSGLFTALLFRVMGRR